MGWWDRYSDNNREANKRGRRDAERGIRDGYDLDYGSERRSAYDAGYDDERYAIRRREERAEEERQCEERARRDRHMRDLQQQQWEYEQQAAIDAEQEMIEHCEEQQREAMREDTAKN